MQPSNQSTDSFHRKVNINPGENFQTAPAALMLSRPKRRDLFGTGLADVLLSLLVMLPFFAASTIVVQDRTNSIQVERTDRWRFELTPSDETLLSLREWGSATPGIGSFAIVSEGDRQLVLRYSRNEQMGPAKPPWEFWGYRQPYLVSSEVKKLKQVARKDGAENSAIVWLSTLAGLAAAGGCIRIRVRHARKGGISLPPLFMRPCPGWWWMFLGAFLLLIGCNQLLPRLARLLTLSDVRYVPPLFDAVPEATTWTMIVVVAAAALLGPVVEECLFRGLVYGRFRACGYGLSGAFVSAAIFAACHGGSILNMAGIAATGLVLAALFHGTRSLWPPIALHALNNLLFLFSLARDGGPTG